MKYCSNCGNQVDDNAIVCTNCGCRVNADLKKELDEPSTGFAAIGFFIPVIGLILYLLWYKDYPQRAKSAGKGALIGTVFSFIFGILLTMISVGATGCALSGIY